MTAHQTLVSAVIVNWQRPANLLPIAARLLEQPFIAEIVVWDNSPDGNLPEELFALSPKIRSLSNGRNDKLWGRFQAIALCEHDWIATQDDDCLVNNWPELYRESLDHPDRITANMHLNEPHGGPIPVAGKAWDVWLGWGSVFRKSLVDGIFNRYIARHGIDPVLLRDADRIFAVLLGRKHHAIQAHCENLPGIDGPEAIHLEPDAKRKTRLARQRAAELLP